MKWLTIGTMGLLVTTIFNLLGLVGEVLTVFDLLDQKQSSTIAHRGGGADIVGEA